MYRFAIYGKGGIGKSTVTTALSCAFAEMGLRVLQVGCDPKADSTLYLHGGQRIDTMLDVLRQKRDSAELADLVHVGYKDIVCAEAGGPTPGLGCAGRGIAADLPRDNAISDAEVQGLPVFETAPDSDYANAVRNLARKMLADYDKENAHDSEAQ